MNTIHTKAEQPAQAVSELMYRSYLVQREHYGVSAEALKNGLFPMADDMERRYQEDLALSQEVEARNRMDTEEMRREVEA